MITNAKILLLCCFCLSTTASFPENAIASNQNNPENIVIAQSFENGFLNRQIWNELLFENRQRKIATKNKEALSYGEVTSIIGYYPTESKNGRHYWIDEINNMTIVVRFHNNQIMDMKGSGF